MRRHVVEVDAARKAGRHLENFNALKSLDNFFGPEMFLIKNFTPIQTEKLRNVFS